MLPGQRFIEDRIVGALRVWMIVGILLRVTRVRDRFDWLSLVYYSTPWPALAAGFLLLAAHHWRRARWHPMRRYIAFTAGALFTWIATSWYSAPAATQPPDVRLVHWNVGHPQGRIDACARWIRRQDPDIICLSEAEPVSENFSARWKAEFPGYALNRGPFGMYCLARGEATGVAAGTLWTDSYDSTTRVRVRDRELTIYQVDLIARPTVSRRVPLERLVQRALGHPGGDMLVIGDFNLPRESWYLDPLRVRYAHAFERGGRGLAETWPIFAPLLALDHVWVGSGWRVLSCRQGWPPLSDHRPVVVELAAAP